MKNVPLRVYTIHTKYESHILLFHCELEFWSLNIHAMIYTVKTTKLSELRR